MNKYIFDVGHPWEKVEIIAQNSKEALFLLGLRTSPLYLRNVKLIEVEECVEPKFYKNYTYIINGVSHTVLAKSESHALYLLSDVIAENNDIKNFELLKED